MTFFDVLRKLIFHRRVNTDEKLDVEGVEAFVPYMINRWLAFYGKAQAVFVNETLNRFTTLFEDKEETYKLYYNLIPTQPYKKISYVKKHKEKVTEETKIIEDIAKNNMLSKREVSLYLALTNKLNN